MTEEVNNLPELVCASGCPRDPGRPRTDHFVQEPMTARFPCPAANAILVSDAPTAELETCKEIPCCTDIPEGILGWSVPRLRCRET